MPTANDGHATAGYPAATPVYQPQVAGQWLAVTAAKVDAEGKVTGLDGVNACGQAAAFCLATTLPVVLPEGSHAGRKFGGVMRGTSTTSALVQEAFPWMDGHGLQQTLLTTATDVSAPGVDAVFGWGLVNGDRAVKGPAWFGDTFVADLGAEDGGVFGNDIGGPGGLLKTGGGRLTLSGQNTYAGATRVQVGTLLLDGRVGGDVVVEDGARFASRGAALTVITPPRPGPKPRCRWARACRWTVPRIWPGK